jgi:hypothetical protein
MTFEQRPEGAGGREAVSDVGMSPRHGKGIGVVWFRNRVLEERGTPMIQSLGCGGPWVFIGRTGGAEQEGSPQTCLTKLTMEVSAKAIRHSGVSDSKEISFGS